MSRQSGLGGRSHLWLMLAVLLIGAFFRLHRLSTVPPSAGYDAAYYGVDALDILQGRFPVYLESNFGREALFSYLVAILFAAIGPSDFAIHLAAAFIGLLTIPATHILLKEFLRTNNNIVIRGFAPIVATACLAFMYWHVVWSRMGVRAILAPLFINLATFTLLRALRIQRKGRFMMAGVVAGLCFYTYQVGQLIPLIFATIIGIELLTTWRQRLLGDHLKSLVALLLSTTLVLLPLIAYAIRYPETYNYRARDVSILDMNASLFNQAQTIMVTSWQVIRFLSVEGDGTLMWSVDRVPGLNGLLLTGLILGLVHTLWHWRRPTAQVIISWLVIMFLPAILADFGPTSKRSLAVLPMLVALIALGWLAPFLALASRFPERKRSIHLGAAVLISGGLIFTLVTTYRDYFITWANDPAKDEAFDPRLRGMARFINDLPGDELIYLSADAPNHPAMLLHSRLRTGGDDVHGYNGWQCLVFPSTTSRPTTYVLSEQRSLTWLEQFFPAGEMHTTRLTTSYGYDDYFVAYHIEPDQEAAFSPQYQMTATWNSEIALLGFDLPQESFGPGQSSELALYWTALREMDARYTAFVHLLGPENPTTGNPIWGQHDSEPCKTFYPTAVWHEGEILRDPITLQTTPDTPPGEYQLSVGFYTWPELQRLPVGDSDALLLHTVVIEVLEE